jgi:phosphoribosylglycinamide formyltransferase 2
LPAPQFAASKEEKASERIAVAADEERVMSTRYRFGTPLQAFGERVMLLGSGELGKEVVIELQRFGVEVWACDSYAYAPAMQVAHHALVFNMADADALRSAISQIKPTLIVPEVEAIATQVLVEVESKDLRVAPTARATQLTMDREGIRRFAAEELGVPTAKYRFADTVEELAAAAEFLGFPCFVKPLMSSSGKGQSCVRSAADLDSAWRKSQTEGRVQKAAQHTAQGARVIVEEFIDFESEITLLTVRAVNGTTFCPPIGHLQVEGDYVESWQPHPMASAQIARAESIAKTVTEGLGGFGLFGVELFLLKNGDVIFSEVSPRPHDTGLVTLVSQDQSEFALHARAVLGLPVHAVRQTGPAASAALRAGANIALPAYDGVDRALSNPNVTLRLFGKPVARPKRRMGVLLATAPSIAQARATAREARDTISIQEASPN